MPCFLFLMFVVLSGCSLTEPNVVACGDDCPGVRGGESGAMSTGGTTPDGSAGEDAQAASGGHSGNGDGGSAGSSGEGGVSGQSGGQGGADGGCAACTSAAPYCNDSTCVACMQDEQCGEHVCIQNACEDCRSDGDCNQPNAARCSENACVACETSAHCAHLEATPVCDQGLCVECTDDDDSACGNAPSGAPYVCDVLMRTCSTTETRGSAGLCEACVSDEQCDSGQLCVMQRFDEPNDDPDQGEQDVAYYCFFREDSDAASAPNGDCANLVPFFSTLRDSTSIAGVKATICGLRVTTCPAYREYSTKTCAGLEDDATCGDERFDDGFCREATTSTFLCTTPCGSSLDCDPGFPCTTTAPKHCSLQ